jgi:hypothetical protein
MQTHLIAIVLVASAASAQVAVLPPRSINIDPERARAFAAVCESAYRSASAQAVVAVDGPGTPPPAELLELSFIGLDGRRTRRILVTGVRKSPQGQPIHEASVEAVSLDEAPLVCQRLATALVQRQSVEETLSYRTVTGSEATRRAGRVPFTRSFGLKTGVIAPVAANDRLAAMGALAFDVRLENERWFYEAGLGFMIPATTPGLKGYGGLSVDLGANAYLTETDFAPYVGVGVQPRLVFSSGSGFNLVPFLQLGATLSRKSSVRLFADARVGQNVLPAVAGVYPTEFNVTLGMAL